MTRRAVFTLLLLVLASACRGGAPADPELPRLEAMRPYLKAGLGPGEAERVFGPPDEVTGSGLLIYVYRLEHRHSLLLGFPGAAPLLYARLRRPDGQLVDLPLQD